MWDLTVFYPGPTGRTGGTNARHLTAEWREPVRRARSAHVEFFRHRGSAWLRHTPTAR